MDNLIDCLKAGFRAFLDKEQAALRERFIPITSDEFKVKRAACIRFMDWVNAQPEDRFTRDEYADLWRWHLGCIFNLTKRDRIIS